MKNKLTSILKTLTVGKRKYVLMAIILIAGAGGWWFWGRTSEPVAPTQQTLVSVSRQDLRETVEVTGSISAANYTQVQTQAVGTVKTVLVTEGQVVEAGDKLFELELTPEGKEANQSAYASYLSAQNSVKSSENQLNSLQVTLFDKNQYFMDHAVKEELDPSLPEYIMESADWLAAEGSYKNQEGVIKQARANLTSAYQNYLNTSATVTAPVAGVVENITAVEGLSFGAASSDTGVSLSDRLATIKTGEQALVIFDLSASEISKVELGQSVTLTSDNLTGDYSGTIVSVDRYGEAGTVTTYQVIASFTLNDEQSSEFMPNLNVDGEILVSEKPGVLAVPTLAISNVGGRSSVMVQDGAGTTSPREVQTGVVSGNMTEIVSGLSEGEQVVFSLSEFSSGNQMGGNMMMMGPAMGGGGMRQVGGGGSTGRGGGG